MNEPTAAEVLETLRRMMKASEYCFIMTHGTGGEINARLMMPYEPDPEFTVYFGAGPNSRKVQEIQKNKMATLALVNPSNAGYASLIGTASVENDPALKSKYWRSFWSDMFPGGPGADDYTLIKFVPERIEVMDYTGQVQPQPYWMKPVGLVRTAGKWMLMASNESL